MKQRVYGYYCPVAHALGAIGERWSLLIIRDLMNGSKRFTDILNRLGNITPKWLSLRLRELENAGIVERVQGRDRREVWYGLTAAGQELRPVIQELRSWGLRHAMRPPLPDEIVHPDLAMQTLVESLNTKQKTLPQSRIWQFEFINVGPFSLSYESGDWKVREGRLTNPDIILEITAEAWTTFLTVPREERKQLAERLNIQGTTEGVGEFLHTFVAKEELQPGRFRV